MTPEIHLNPNHPIHARYLDSAIHRDGHEDEFFMQVFEAGYKNLSKEYRLELAQKIVFRGSDQLLLFLLNREKDFFGDMPEFTLGKIFSTSYGILGFEYPGIEKLLEKVSRSNDWSLWIKIHNLTKSFIARGGCSLTDLIAFLNIFGVINVEDEHIKKLLKKTCDKKEITHPEIFKILSGKIQNLSALDSVNTRSAILELLSSYLELEHTEQIIFEAQFIYLCIEEVQNNQDWNCKEIMEYLNKVHDENIEDLSERIRFFLCTISLCIQHLPVLGGNLSDIPQPSAPAAIIFEKKQKREILEKINQSIFISDVVMLPENKKGEFKNKNSSMESVTDRLCEHLDQIIKIVEIIHLEKNFENTNSEDGKISYSFKENRENQVTRLLTPEFSFYTYGAPLSSDEFQKILDHLLKVSRTLPNNLELFFSSFAVENEILSRDNADSVPVFNNVVVYVRKGKVRAFSKNKRHALDPGFLDSVTNKPYLYGAYDEGRDQDYHLPLLQTVETKRMKAQKYEAATYKNPLFNYCGVVPSKTVFGGKYIQVGEICFDHSFGYGEDIWKKYRQTRNYKLIPDALSHFITSDSIKPQPEFFLSAQIAHADTNYIYRKNFKPIIPTDELEERLKSELSDLDVEIRGDAITVESPKFGSALEFRIYPEDLLESPKASADVVNKKLINLFFISKLRNISPSDDLEIKINEAWLEFYEDQIAALNTNVTASAMRSFTSSSKEDMYKKLCLIQKLSRAIHALDPKQIEFFREKAFEIIEKYRVDAEKERFLELKKVLDALIEEEVFEKQQQHLEGPSSMSRNFS